MLTALRQSVAFAQIGWNLTGLGALAVRKRLRVIRNGVSSTSNIIFRQTLPRTHNSEFSRQNSSKFHQNSTKSHQSDLMGHNRVYNEKSGIFDFARLFDKLVRWSGVLGTCLCARNTFKGSFGSVCIEEFRLFCSRLAYDHPRAG